MTILDLSGSSFSALTTSGTFDFTVTRDDIVRYALKYIGKLGDSQQPTPGMMQDGAFFLNAMVKQWMEKQDFAPGLKMWSRQRGELFLSTTQYQYSLGPTGDHWTADYTQLQTTASAIATATVISVADTSDVDLNDYIGIVLNSGALFWTRVVSFTSTTITILDALTGAVSSGAYVFVYTTKQQRPLEIATVLLRDVNNSDTPLNVMTLQTYEALPNKTQAGYQSDPTAIYYEAQLGNGQLYVDVGGAQDVTKHLHIVFLRPIMNLDNPLDTPEYSQQWFLALILGLGKLLAPVFKVVWTNEAEDNFKMALAIAKETVPETTEIYFQPYADATPYG